MKTYRNFLKTESWILHRKKFYLYPIIMRVKIIQSGQKFSAISKYDIVLFLWQNSFQKEKTIEQFMINYARRAVLFNDENIRANTINDFVDDLEELKHIEIKEKPILN